MDKAIKSQPVDVPDMHKESDVDRPAAGSKLDTHTVIKAEQKQPTGLVQHKREIRPEADCKEKQTGKVVQQLSAASASNPSCSAGTSGAKSNKRQRRSTGGMSCVHRTNKPYINPAFRGRSNSSIERQYNDPDYETGSESSSSTSSDEKPPKPLRYNFGCGPTLRPYSLSGRGKPTSSAESEFHANRASQRGGGQASHSSKEKSSSGAGERAGGSSSAGVERGSGSAACDSCLKRDGALSSGGERSGGSEDRGSAVTRADARGTGSDRGDGGGARGRGGKRPGGNAFAPNKKQRE